jgi:flagellar motility protein MotE (MotC chaperone)
MGNVRVLPLLVFAGLCRLGLKAMGLLLSGSYVLSGSAPASAQQQAEKDQSGKDMPAGKKDGAEMKAAQAGSDKNPGEKPASKQMAKPEGSEGKSEKTANKKKLNKKNIAPEEDERLKGGPNGGVSKSEMAVLESLASRRKDLDTRTRELGLRENLLKAAEKRVEARITELKTIESRIEGELKKRDDFRNNQYQRLVKMYSGMKPKDAARIFNRLDINVLTGLVAKMKPRIMSAILSSMAPAAAERLTMEIANRGQPITQAAASLPKIPSQRSN